MNWITTCKGKRNRLVIRVRLEQVDAGNGYHVGTGTWKVVRGTGRYTQITGGGRVGNAWVDSGPWRERLKASSPFRSAMAQDRAARSLVRRYYVLADSRAFREVVFIPRVSFAWAARCRSLDEARSRRSRASKRSKRLSELGSSGDGQVHFCQRGGSAHRNRSSSSLEPRPCPNVVMHR